MTGFLVHAEETCAQNQNGQDEPTEACADECTGLGCRDACLAVQGSSYGGWHPGVRHDRMGLVLDLSPGLFVNRMVSKTCLPQHSMSCDSPHHRASCSDARTADAAPSAVAPQQKASTVSL